MENEKKKHTGLWVVLAILIVVVVFAVAAFLMLYPKWKDAVILQDHMDLQHYTYELQLDLNKDAMPASTTRSLDMLAEAVGLETESMYQLRIEGSVYDDRIYAVVYPKGEKNPLTEIYLSDDKDLINGAMIYNAMINRILGDGQDNPLLSLLVPRWSDNEYMTLEQMSQMMETNVDGLGKLRQPLSGYHLSAKEYFAGLLMMDREAGKTESTYHLDAQGAELHAKVPGDNNGSSAVAVKFSMQQPAKMMQDINEKLSKLKVEIPADRFAAYDEVIGEIYFGAAKEIHMPDQIISDETAAFLSGIQAFFREISGK